MNIVGPDAPKTRSLRALATAEPRQTVFPAVADTALSAKVAGLPAQAALAPADADHRAVGATIGDDERLRDAAWPTVTVGIPRLDIAS